VRPIEKELVQSLNDVEQTIEVQNIVHHSNSWRLQSVYCFGCSISLMLLMFAPILGTLLFLSILYSLRQEFIGEEGWFRGFSRKQIGNNYLLWNCNRFPTETAVQPLNENLTIFALNWNYRQEKRLEHNWFQGALFFIGSTSIIAAIILLGWIDLSLTGLAILLLTGIILRFLPPTPLQLANENISLAKRILNECVNDNYMIVLFEGSSTYDALDTFLRNYTPLFQPDTTTVVQLQVTEGNIVEQFHISQKKKSQESKHPCTFQYTPVHRPSHLGWSFNYLQGNSEELFNAAHQQYDQCSSSAS